VTLAEGTVPGTIDAKVAVTDNNPLRIITTLDNTGSPSSGRWRTGVALQHANLFDRDHVGTLAYTTSPDSPSGVRLDVYSVGYRIPLYALWRQHRPGLRQVERQLPGHVARAGRPAGLYRQGRHLRPALEPLPGPQRRKQRQAGAGLDRKQHRLALRRGRRAVSIAPPTPPISSCVPYVTTPLSITYSSQRESVDQTLGLQPGPVAQPGERRALHQHRRPHDRYSYLTPGNRGTRDGFMAARGSASLFKAFCQRLAGAPGGSAQYTNTPLVAGEQFGLAGSTLVRGFQERAVAADSGIVANAELYTPELAGSVGLPGQLRGVWPSTTRATAPTTTWAQLRAGPA
jgi:hypothetical protein